MTQNNTQFDQSIKNLKAVSLAPEEKGRMFKSLLRYAETHQPVRTTVWSAFMRFFRGSATAKEATSYKIK
jgi:hypothetical protein